MCCCGCGWYPERCGSTGTDGLSLSPWVVPRLLSTMITPSARTKHIYRTREDEQREHCVKGFCAFSLISFLTYFLLSGSSGHINWTLPSVNSSPFSSHHEGKSLLTAQHPHPVQQCPPGFPQPSPSRGGGLHRDCLSHNEPGETRHRYCTCCTDGKPRQRAAKCTIATLRYLSLSFKEYLALSNIFAAWR